MRTWRDKANEIIAKYSLASYRQANILSNGRKRRHHVPYSIPEIATALVAALDRDDEHEAKRLFQVEATGSTPTEPRTGHRSGVWCVCTPTTPQPDPVGTSHNPSSAPKTQNTGRTSNPL